MVSSEVRGGEERLMGRVGYRAAATLDVDRNLSLIIVSHPKGALHITDPDYWP